MCVQMCASSNHVLQCICQLLDVLAKTVIIYQILFPKELAALLMASFSDSAYFCGMIFIQQIQNKVAEL